jgi:hypothetical protein
MIILKRKDVFSVNEEGVYSAGKANHVGGPDV